MVSARIERETGLETVPHLTTRDWTVLGLESMLLGAHAEGVRNVLAITGDPPEVGDYPGSRGVYEIDAIGLTQLITRLNRGEDFNGRPIDAPDLVLRRCRRQPDRRRPRGGGRAVPPQGRGGREVRDDADRVRPRRRSTASREAARRLWPIPVLAGVFPLTSHRLALRLHNEVPGIIVPQQLQDALARGGPRRGRRSASPTRRSSSPRRADAARASTSSRRTSGPPACSSSSR